MGTTSIADAAIGGVKFDIQPTMRSARSFLDDGDVPGLLAFRKAQFGGYRLEDDDDSDDDADDGDDDEDDEDDDSDDEGDDESAKDKEIEALKAENKRRRLKARQQDQAMKDLQREVAALKKGKGKDKDDAGDGDDQSEEVATLTKDRDTLLGANDDLRIENAFLKSTKHSWKNPASALRLLDRSDIEIDEDGQVDGLDDALDALAKSDPYLLADDDKDEDEDEDEKPKTRRKTGQRSGGRGTKSKTPDRAALEKKYPQLVR